MGSRVPLKILFVVPYAPTRIRTRPYHLIRALLADGHELTVATLWTHADERKALDRLASDGAVVVAERLRLGRSLVNCLRAMPSGDPLQAHFCWHPSLAQRILDHVRKDRPDVVHVEHLRGVRYGLALARALPTAPALRPVLVWDSVDCISALFRRAAEQSPSRRVRLAARLELPRTERYEGRVLTAFDRVLVTSAIDRRELSALASERQAPGKSARIDVVPNGVDLDYFSPSQEPRDEDTLVITGKMSYHANATAVVRFVEDVMPTVWASRPRTRVWIVGKDPTTEIVRLGKMPLYGEKLQVTGFVDDIRPFLQRATVAVAPIQYGVGIQNKVLEAMACGAPIVASAEAVSALRAESGVELMVASTPSEVAASLLHLLECQEARRRLGEAARSFVERHHDWRRLTACLANIYAHART